MKVKELLKHLNEADPESDVYIKYDEDMVVTLWSEPEWIGITDDEWSKPREDRLYYIVSILSNAAG